MAATAATAAATAVTAAVTSGGDDDEGGLGELNYTEFTSLLQRVANAKFPPETRGGEPFEATWRSFLGLLFVPRFKILLKAKKQGAGRTTLDGRLF